MMIPANLLEAIKTTYTREEVTAKTMLVKEGSVAKKLYFIEQGCCRVWFNNDGKDVTFQFLFEGHFASSFETIMTGATSWYSIETLEPAVVFSITVDDLKQRMEMHPHIKNFFNQYVLNRLIFFQQLFVSHIKDMPELRYKELIARHPEIVLRVPQHYIASYLGITSVSLSRIRNRK